MAQRTRKGGRKAAEMPPFQPLTLEEKCELASTAIDALTADIEQARFFD